RGAREMRASLRTLGYVAAAVAAVPALAGADSFEAFPASNCLIEGDNASDCIFSGLELLNNSNGLGARPRTVHCPMLSTTAYPTPSLTSVHVYGNDHSQDLNNGSVFVKICYLNSAGAVEIVRQRRPHLR